jgi:tetrahydrodipicolinate N-succinyltransferase
MTMTDQLAATIDAAWESRDAISTATTGEVREAVNAALGLLDSGQARVAEKVDGQWRVNQWLKKAVLLSFRLNAMEQIPGGPGGAPWWDKVDSKFLGWDATRFGEAGFRAVPGCIVRKGAHIAPGAVLMPSFVNLGASTKIVDRATGAVMYGRVPAYSVVVPGAMPSDKGGPSLACAVIVKCVDERTRSKTSINELLRD